MEEKFKDLLKYIAKNHWTESIFSSPNPQTNVEIVGLLDKIAELRGITPEQNGLEFNEILDDLSKQ